MARVPALVVGVLVVAGCGGGSEPSAQVQQPPARKGLRDVSSVLQLRAAFNEDRGSPRLLVLLSPT
jgi:hypothetical protein